MKAGFEMKRIMNMILRFDTIYNRLILSFIVIVIVVAATVSGFLIVQFSSNYNQKVEKLEESRISDIEGDINKIFQDADSIMIEISTTKNKDADIQNVLDYKIDNDYYKITKVQEYIKVLDSQNSDFLESIEFYSLKNNIWISSKSGIKFINGEDESNAKLQSILGTNTSFMGFHRWLSGRIIDNDNVEIPVYSYVAGYPLYTSDQSKFKGYIIVNIRQEAIRSLLVNSIQGDNNAIGIMESDGSINLSAGNERLFDELKNDKKNLMEISSYPDKQKSVKSKNNIVISHRIGDEEWKLVDIYSMKDFYNETDKIKLRSFCFCVAAIIAGILLSYQFARKLYKPLYLIVNKLNKAKLSKKARENEYYYIDRAIEELSTRAIIQEEVLNKNKSSIKQDLVVKILAGKQEEKHDVLYKLELLGYQKNVATNFILLIRLHKKIYDSLDKEKISQINFKIIDFFDEYSSGRISCIPADLFNGNICAVISMMEKDMEQINILRLKFNDYMIINFMLNPIILQSEGFLDLELAHQQYTQLLRVSEYTYFLPHIYFYDLEVIKDKLQDQMNKGKPNFELFTESLVTRDLEQIKSILKSFIEDPEVFSNSVDNLHSYVLKFVFLYNYYLRDIMKEYKNVNNTEIFKQINNLYDVEDFYFWFVNLIKTTFSELSVMEDNPKKTVISLIENVIQESIEEENLSLDYIAEKIYMSPKYISRIFKEETDMKITQYITDCKLKKAAKLLIETSISLEDLIKQVGFSSTNYFIKKFKESYFVTPTQYRRNSII